MTIHAIYASTSGNVEVVVETAAQVLRDAGHEVILHRAEQTPLDVIKDNGLFLIATSTWEHGVLNPFFQRLYKEMKDQSFAGKKAAFIGCGDSRYEPILFNQGIKIVQERWLAQQGEAIHRLHLVNGDPYHQLELIKIWAKGLVELL